MYPDFSDFSIHFSNLHNSSEALLSQLRSSYQRENDISPETSTKQKIKYITNSIKQTETWLDDLFNIPINYILHPVKNPNIQHLQSSFLQNSMIKVFTSEQTNSAFEYFSNLNIQDETIKTMLISISQPASLIKDFQDTSHKVPRVESIDELTSLLSLQNNSQMSSLPTTECIGKFFVNNYAMEEISEALKLSKRKLPTCFQQIFKVEIPQERVEVNEVVKEAINFLKSDIVQDRSKEEIVHFLKSKNMSDEEINQAIEISNVNFLSDPSVGKSSEPASDEGEKLQKSVQFLKHPQVRYKSMDFRIQYLKSKGVPSSIIIRAFEESGEYLPELTKQQILSEDNLSTNFTSSLGDIQLNTVINEILLLKEQHLSKGRITSSILSKFSPQSLKEYNILMLAGEGVGLDLSAFLTANYSLSNISLVLESMEKNIVANLNEKEQRYFLVEAAKGKLAFQIYSEAISIVLLSFVNKVMNYEISDLDLMELLSSALKCARRCLVASQHSLLLNFCFLLESTMLERIPNIRNSDHILGWFFDSFMFYLGCQTSFIDPNDAPVINLFDCIRWNIHFKWNENIGDKLENSAHWKFILVSRQLDAKICFNPFYSSLLELILKALEEESFLTLSYYLCVLSGIFKSGCQNGFALDVVDPPIGELSNLLNRIAFSLNVRAGLGAEYKQNIELEFSLASLGRLYFHCLSYLNLSLLQREYFLFPLFVYSIWSATGIISFNNNEKVDVMSIVNNESFKTTSLGTKVVLDLMELVFLQDIGLEKSQLLKEVIFLVVDFSLVAARRVSSSIEKKKELQVLLPQLLDYSYGLKEINSSEGDNSLKGLVQNFVGFERICEMFFIFHLNLIPALQKAYEIISTSSLRRKHRNKKTFDFITILGCSRVFAIHTPEYVDFEKALKSEIRKMKKRDLTNLQQYYFHEISGIAKKEISPLYVARLETYLDFYSQITELTFTNGNSFSNYETTRFVDEYANQLLNFLKTNLPTLKHQLQNLFINLIEDCKYFINKTLIREINILKFPHCFKIILPFVNTCLGLYPQNLKGFSFIYNLTQVFITLHETNFKIRESIGSSIITSVLLKYYSVTEDYKHEVLDLLFLLISLLPDSILDEILSTVAKDLLHSEGIKAKSSFDRAIRNCADSYRRKYLTSWLMKNFNLSFKTYSKL
eukprot:snap_masked-scaffold_25-processed-gene-2.50-mRNA-1 protein AED:1.00 eAED:1.00 QI:0/0/0/0/1/1/3/0/1166